MENVKLASPVILNYEDLVNGVDLSADIEKAYGYEGLGILAVRGVPGVEERRNALLPLSRKYAMLPEEVKKKTETPSTTYSFGWSHGNETLQGHPDFSKGSYYNNPQYDCPVEDEEEIKKYPSFFHPNVWPDDLPELAGAFKNAGQLMVEVGKLVAQQCDVYVKKMVPTFKRELKGVIETSKCCKGRLLHYFPQPASDNVADDFGSWCGWHNDHGSLTALMSGMFINAEGNVVPCPDERAGLYIRSRQGDLYKVSIGADLLAYQIGETAQIHSGGVLQATPHAVRGAMGPGCEGISREQFAVFMEPNPTDPVNVPENVDPMKAQRGSNEELLPKGVSPLGTRWQANMDFNDFTIATLSMTYS